MSMPDYMQICDSFINIKQEKVVNELNMSVSNIL